MSDADDDSFIVSMESLGQYLVESVSRYLVETVS